MPDPHATLTKLLYLYAYFTTELKEGQTAYKTSIFKSIFRLMLWIVVAVIVLIVIFVLFTQAYLESQERKVLDNLPYLNDTQLSVGSTHISLFKNFPEATITINDIRLGSPSQQDSTISVSDLNADIIFNLEHWRTKDIVINKVELSNGTIKVIEPGDGSGVLDKLISQFENKTDSIYNSNKDIKFNTAHLILGLTDIDLSYSDPHKTTFLSGTINHLRTAELMSDSIVTLKLLDLHINELTFKKRQGSYLKNAYLKGRDIVVEKSTEGLLIHPTLLDINKQIFKTEIFLSRVNNPTYIKLENRQTRLNAILPLLPRQISTKIKPYKISGPFPTKAKLIFKKGEPAYIDINFNLLGNDTKINKLELSSTYADGYFTNRFNKQKGITLILKDFRSKRETFLLESEMVVVSSNPIQKATIESEMIIKGSAEELNKHFESENFMLERGLFKLEGHIDGSLSNLGNLLEKSDIKLEISDLDINYIPAQTLIPIKDIRLTKKGNETKFIIQSTTLKSGYPYHLDGQLTNLTSLISDYTETTTTSKILLKADRFGWEDFVSIFSKSTRVKNNKRKSDGDSKQSMKSTLRGIDRKFQPTIKIQIDTFEYYNILDLYQLETSAFFDKKGYLILDETKFNLDQGNITAQAKLNIKAPNKTGFRINLNGSNLDLTTLMPTFNYFNVTLLKELDQLPDDFNMDIVMAGEINDTTGLLTNTLNGEIHFDSDTLDNINGDIKFNSTSGKLTSDLNLSGNPELFNDLFKNDEFIFQDAGQFNASITHKGDIISLEELIEYSKTKLTIKDGAVLYKDVNVIFPLNDLELGIVKDTANFNLHLYSDILDREININGDIDNLSELIFNNNKKVLTTRVNATSPIINLSHALGIFVYPQDTTSNSTISTPSLPIDQKMKTLISSLFKRFQPDLHIELDTFVITDKISLINLSTGCELIDSTHFRLDSTNFDFNGGNVKLAMEIDISKENEEPFSTNLTTTNLDLASSLEALDHLGSKSLKNANLIEGRLDLALDFKGSLRNLKLITNKNEGTIHFNLSNLKLRSVDVIDEISYKLYSPGLFDDLEFAPLINTLKIKGSKIEVPQMEIQSNEVDFFIEGHIDNPKNTNIWLSIPLDNILRKNKSSLKSRGYNTTKRKIYLEISPDKKGETKTKLRFRKKKFYKQRGLDWKKYR